jgi:uncharacterized RDD family membrane protein YckC
VTSAEEYIAEVVDRLPRDTPMRAQIEMELRALIDERMQQGQPLDDILRKLGDPERLAESYVAAIPLVKVSFGDRAMAKIADYGVAVLVVSPIVALCWWLIRPVYFFMLAPVVIALGASYPVLMLYTIWAESQTEQTMGKRMLGIRVVRETGTRISVGQAIVRQLPWLFQIFWLDAFFALFTDRHQRAFELLSKTRVVRVQSQEAVT